MKIRTGFVSNSSSSSFVLEKEGLTKQQLEAIEKWFKKVDSDYNNRICETKKHFFGELSYHNNPSLYELLEDLGVNRSLLEVEE